MNRAVHYLDHGRHLFIRCGDFIVKIQYFIKGHTIAYFSLNDFLSPINNWSVREKQGRLVSFSEHLLSLGGHSEKPQLSNLNYVVISLHRALNS